MVALADGRRAPSASRDHTLKIWDLETGVLLRTLEGHTEMVYGVAALPDPRRAISCSEDRTVKLWDLANGRCVATWTADEPVRCVAAGLREVEEVQGAALVAGHEESIRALPSSAERV